jgi:hypothetical protein
MDHVKLFNVERGLYILGQTFDWQPANSLISDFYVYTYPNPQGGIRLETLPTGEEGDAWMMNSITFVRPQVNSFNSGNAPGTTGIWLKGFSPERPVQRVWIVSADVEGEYEVAIRLENARQNRLEVAGVTFPSIGLSLDAGSEGNIIHSTDDKLTVSVAGTPQNLFLGHFDVPDDTLLRGIYNDRQSNRWSISLGQDGRFQSGSGAAWFDEASGSWRLSGGGSAGEGGAIVTGTGSSAARGPVLWADVGTSCHMACDGAGMEQCVDAWSGSVAVGCAATEQQRICACR